MNNSSVINEYRKNSRKKLLVIAGICILYVATIIIALLSGSADYQLNEVLRLISGNSDAFTEQILFQIRIPRILGAMLAGTALAVSGAAIQSLLRNPLASPFTLGISGAAAFGAALCIVFIGNAISIENNSASLFYPY
ncbi:MAG TPA: iron chelate uptake ABC transporter family permease subunit, partial [Bacteroidales bacterium]|nr:iron chelate uptake ABC transporter family permease subunit [Bacteroidales bacterium]